MNKTVLICVLSLLVGATSWAAGPSSFDAVMEHYEPIRLSLLGDSMDGVNANGEAIAAELRALEAEFSTDRAGASEETAAVVQAKLNEMIEAADAIASAKSLEAARDGFYALTRPMVQWREGVSQSDRPAVAYCPMHKRSWLQPGEEIGNPYGAMPRCGSIVSK
jgi:hypothetical protein